MKAAHLSFLHFPVLLAPPSGVGVLQTPHRQPGSHLFPSTWCENVKSHSMAFPWLCAYVFIPQMASSSRSTHVVRSLTLPHHRKCHCLWRQRSGIVSGSGELGIGDFRDIKPAPFPPSLQTRAGPSCPPQATDITRTHSLPSQASPSSCRISVVGPSPACLFCGLG